MNRCPLLVEIVSCGRCNLHSAAAPRPHPTRSAADLASILQAGSAQPLAIRKPGTASAYGTLAGPIGIRAVHSFVVVVLPAACQWCHLF